MCCTVGSRRTLQPPVEQVNRNCLILIVPSQLSLSLRVSHAHKNTVMEVKWNLNGNWLLTASRDHLCKLFDIRNLKEELQVFRGHKKEATGESVCPQVEDAPGL